MGGLALLSLLLPLAAAQNCYYPNGTDANAGYSSPRYVACNAKATASMCCDIRDTCVSDGLCYSGWYDGNTWRDFCTDKSWQDPACTKLCVNGTGIPYANNPANRSDTSVTVTRCPDGSYCCGHGSQAATCCQKGGGYFLEDGEAQKNNPSASTSAAVSTSTASTKSRKSTNSAQPTAIAATSTNPGAVTLTASATPQPSKKSSNTGAIVGGVIGGLAALALLAGLGFFLWRRRRAGNGQQRRPGMKYSEMDGNGKPAEVPAEYYSSDRKAREGGDTELDSLPRAEMPMENAQEQEQDRRRVTRQELPS